MVSMHIDIFTSNVGDNFFYLVTDGDDALLVDPVDSEQAIAAIQERSPQRVRILVTHGHPDHVMGNAAVMKATGATTIGSAHGNPFGAHIDEEVRDADVVTVGQGAWRVYDAPGHTVGHLVLHHPGYALSGDVYFIGGAGNCRFGGDPGELYRTFHERLAELPDETRIYPGHDYARRNLEFVLSVEPDNTGAQQLYEKVKDRERSRDGLYVGTLGEERSYNPFHRVGEPALQAHLAERYPKQTDESVADPAERAFRTLRALRDAF